MSARREIDRQLTLFGIEVHGAPIHHRAGSMTLRQCAQCGVLVATPDCGTYKANEPLGPSPRCGQDTWWRQRFPVGGLSRPTAAPDDQGRGG